jgi:MFS family permease
LGWHQLAVHSFYDFIVAAPLLLLLLRVLQGAAIEGEAPGAWVFVAEHCRHWNRKRSLWDPPGHRIRPAAAYCGNLCPLHDRRT